VLFRSDERAQDCYRRAWHEMLVGTPAAFERAMRLVMRGIETVGEHPVLMAATAQMQYVALEWGFEPRGELLAAAVDYTRRVEASAPELASAILAKLERFTGSQLRAIRHFEQAVERDPSDTVSLWFLSHSYSLLAGQPGAGLAVAERLLAVDPLSALNLFNIAAARWGRFDFDGALQAIAEFDSREPGHFFSAVFRPQLLARAGRLDDALRAAEADAAAQHSFSAWSAMLAHALRREGSRVVSVAEGPAHELLWTDAESPLFAGGCLALAGECERALDWLERWVDRGSFNYPLLAQGDPLLESVRGEPRFRRLLDRVRPVWENFVPRFASPDEA